MSRIRTIKPDTFRSETLSDVSLAAERTFIGLWCEVDDDGRIRERPAVINGALWSLRPEHTVAHLESDLAELQNAELICRYDVAGNRYIHLPSWKEHQRINRPTASKLPACPTCTLERGGSQQEHVASPAEATLFGPGGGTVTELSSVASERRG